MTANYFVLSKDGRDLYADYAPFAQGGGPTTRSVTDGLRGASFRTNLVTNPSFETNTTGWSGSGSPISTLSRQTSSPAPLSGNYWLKATPGSDSNDGGVVTNSIAVVEGETYTASAYLIGDTDGANGTFGIIWQDSSFSTISVSNVGSLTWTPTTWNRASVTAVGPAGAGSARIQAFVQPAGKDGDFIGLDAVLFEKSPSLGSYFDGSTVDASWTGAAHASTSRAPVYDVTPSIVGVPGDLSGHAELLMGLSMYVEPTYVPAPTGFIRSAFRAVRDPAVVTDDSGDTLGAQIYRHGWVLGDRLTTYLSENGPIPWPGNGGFEVVPVTGTPAVNDGAGTYGLTAVTWPGTGVGVGTLRQVVAGDEGTGRKVAAILDLLAATTSGQRDTIGSTFTASAAAIATARENLIIAAKAASEATMSQFSGRSPLAAVLGSQAVDADRGSVLEKAVHFAMHGVVGLEAGLVGATFTSANYQTLTDPIDAVLAMPSGY